MTSLLTKSALNKLPADIRDHIQVVSETGYSITLAMTIGDLERLTGHFTTLDDLREALGEAECQALLAQEAATDAEAERDDEASLAEGLAKERDEIAAAVQTYLGVLDIDHPVDSPQAEALKALEDLL